MSNNNEYSRPDHYTKKAKAQGFAARSVFKLEEIHQRHRIFQRGDAVIDLGCAPGSWSRYANQRTGEPLVGVDLVEVKSVPGTFLLGSVFDITPEALDTLVVGLKKAGVNTPLNGSVPSGIRPLGFHNASGSFRNASVKPPINPGALLTTEAEVTVDREWIVTGNPECTANIRDLAILPLLTGLADFCGDNATSWFRQRISNNERISADLLKFIVLEVWRITLGNYSLHQRRINGLVKHQDRLICFHPWQEQISVFAPLKHFLNDLNRQLDVTHPSLVLDPSPELWDTVDWVIRIARCDEHVRIEEMEHDGFIAPLSRLRAVARRSAASLPGRDQPLCR